MSWPTFWQQKNWQTFLLKPLSALVCTVSAKRLREFEQIPPKSVTAAKVIVVGNIVVGGTGKTPFIIWLAQQLKAAGLTYGIISRGYGAKVKQPIRVKETSLASEVGDEPLMLCKTLNCPVVVYPKRVEAIQLLAEDNLDVIISDDGLQHFAMARDMELVLVDGQRQFGNQLCLPAGPLREPISRLQKVDFVIWNGGKSEVLAENEYAMTLQPVVFRSVKEPSKTLPIESFSGQAVQMMAGIGNPDRFFATMTQLGVTGQGSAFPDHYAYQPSDFESFDTSKPLIMTEKDAVKCRAFALDNWWYLEVAPKCDQNLAQQIITRLKDGS